MNNLLKLISELTTFHIKQFSQDSGSMIEWSDTREKAEVHEGANAVSSLRWARTEEEDLFLFLSDEAIPAAKERKHAVLLDLDVPAYLIPSSTEGHSHLYIDVEADEDAYFRLLDALVACNVIEPGYAGASKKKGATFLRLPWVKKTAEERA